MKVAFFAPLKDPEHPVPSGDRTMARALQAALKLAGHSVCPISRLRIYDKMGEPRVQDRLFDEADAEVERLLAQPEAQTWKAWVTYHNYYKAPDLIGPKVCAKLGLPYILIEATRARKRLRGPWARFAEAAEAACDAAQTIFFFTEQDAEALFRDAPDGQAIVHLPPFLAREDLPSESARTGPVLSVGMMRPGDKLASYALIAETLALLDQPDWQLQIAGDGPARPDVERMMARFGDKVSFLGALDPAALAAAYGTSQCLFWPGVNEAFGMVYLEAQATGLPVVAQDRPGVCDVVHSPLADTSGGANAMAKRLGELLSDTSLREAEGRANRQKTEENHLLSAAARRLDRVLRAA